MTRTVTLTASAERDAFRSIRRVCDAGLDSVSLRMELARRIAPIIPVEAYSLATTDPDTGLLTHAIGDGLPISLVKAYIEMLYPHEKAAMILDQMRHAETVTQNATEMFRAVLSEVGIGHELHTVLCADGGLWGSWCMLRETDSAAFNDREMSFMRRIAPHVGRGLRTGTLIDMATAPAGAGDPQGAPGDALAPGVLVLDARGCTTLRTPAAAHLHDLQDIGMGPEDVPYSVASAVLQVRVRQSLASLGRDGDVIGQDLHVRGRSGRWYTLRASMAEPDASGESATVVVIEPAGKREIAPILTRVYGLSPREREVLVLAARGETSKRIAGQLGISTYTVQDHLDHACEKVGVRGRKALLAKLFFDVYVPRLDESEGSAPAASPR